MEGFKAVFINEIEKMYKKKKAVVIVVISLLMIILGQLAVTVVSSGFGIRGASSTQFPMLVLSVFANTILPLFTALVAIDAFANEFSLNTMKIMLIRPVTRLKLFSAKIAAVMFFVLTNLIIVMTLSALTALIFNSTASGISGFMKVIISYLVTLVPIMIMTLIIVFLANIFRSGVIVFFLAVVALFGFKVLGIIFPQYSSLFITSMLDWYNLWIADTLPVSRILRQLLIMSGYGIMFFTAGYYLFDKKDL